MRLTGSEHITLYPLGYEGEEDTTCDAPLTYRELRDDYINYRAVLQAFTSYAMLLECLISYANVDADYTDYTDLDNQVDTYEDLLEGSPGYGGETIRPVGVGIEFGVRKAGVEWWTVSAQGLVDSAAWQDATAEPALMDGSWALQVRATGREITVTGTLVGDSHETLTDAVRLFAAALAAPPRLGWLEHDATDGKKRISVALGAPSKVKWIGRLGAECQVTLKGVDLGTPGAGVHLESDAIVIEPDEVEENYVIGGLIPTQPQIELFGPLEASSFFVLNGYRGDMVEDLPAGSKIQIDCRTRQMTIDGIPTRDYVAFSEPQWPLLAAPVSPMRAVMIGGGGIRVTVTPLW